RLPALQAITCAFDDVTHQITLHHPDLPDLTFNPDTNAQALLSWVAPLIPKESGRQPGRLVRAAARGMTDTDFPSVTLCNLSSHRAVQDRVGRALSIHRWRGNIWIDGLAPWEEFDWVGHEVQVGEAVFAVRERAVRCRATESNPDTGRRDTNVLGALKSWDHQDFSVYAEVIRDGAVTLNDGVYRL
ncbi:MAG: MOSC domain-containing protein, partial [Paracoccaceae bacterium]